MKKLQAAAALMLTCAALAASAHGEGGHDKVAAAVVKEQKPWGIAADAGVATRIIEIGMSDQMRFRPSRIQVQQGETIRFVVKNHGKMLHEMVIGTKDELERHAALMAKFPGMEHDEPYMAHVRAGKQRDLVWTFNRAGTFHFACLIRGHYQAGMVGAVFVAPETPSLARGR